MLLGRPNTANSAIAHLLAQAQLASALPQVKPSRILLNRLWPLGLVTLLSGGLSFLAPQVPGIAAGFAIIWALAWRKQEQAVLSIEERDGMQFYVERTSPFRAIKLVRTPGFKRETRDIAIGNGQPR
jgi:hypothetical protein